MNSMLFALIFFVTMTLFMAYILPVNQNGIHLSIDLELITEYIKMNATQAVPFIGPQSIFIYK